MLTFYTVPVSLYCAKLRILLRHKGLEWREAPPPGGYGSKEYKAQVPAGNLPAMDDDGFCLSDSEAIAEYLNEKHPQPAMLPASLEARARVRMLSRFHDTRLEPSVRALFGQLDPAARSAEFVQAQAAVIASRLAALVPLLPRQDRPLSLGDCGYPVTFAWIERLSAHLSFPVAWPDAAVAYAGRVERHAAVAEELRAYRPQLDAWLASR